MFALFLTDKTWDGLIRFWFLTLNLPGSFTHQCVLWAFNIKLLSLSDIRKPPQLFVPHWGAHSLLFCLSWSFPLDKLSRVESGGIFSEYDPQQMLSSPPSRHTFYSFHSFWRADHSHAAGDFHTADVSQVRDKWEHMQVVCGLAWRIMTHMNFLRPGQDCHLHVFKCLHHLMWSVPALWHLFVVVHLRQTPDKMKSQTAEKRAPGVSK